MQDALRHAAPAPAARKQAPLMNGSARGSGKGGAVAAGGRKGQKGADSERKDLAQLKREQQLAEEALVRLLFGIQPGHVAQSHDVFNKT